ncbi:MAG TPA: TolC family protein [Terriglobales bacterium]|nr:TolC family protein [Terriglobales bacterium]
MELRLALSSILLCVVVGIAPAQTVRERETFRGLTSPQIVADTLPGPKYMREHIVDGKINLSLQDAVVLTLANNSNVRIQELNVENSKYGVLTAHQPFDPSALASFSDNRARFQAFSTLSGNPTPNVLSQSTQLNYTQTFETGTNFLAGFSVNRVSSNSTDNFLNPSIASSVNLQFTQPLLRNRWLFANRAPLVIARRSLKISRALFESQVSDAIAQAVSQYWTVVQATGDLQVARKSLEAAEATYRRDKRALELGALPPLDIYRSESQVAARRVQLIQAEYTLKQTEDALRLTIGADLDPYLRALDLELTEAPDPAGELRNVDFATALQQALDKRPEFEAARQSLANDETSIRLTHNNLLPDMRLSANYSSNGLGGNQFNTNVTPPQLISSGGFGDSLSQLFGFGYPSYGFSLTLNLPVRNRGGEAALGNALVSRRRDLYSERQVREQITLETANAVHQLEQAKISTVASKEAVDLSQKSMAAEQRKYDLGSGTIFLVLEAQTELAAAEQTLLQSEIGYQLALTAVDHATGELLQPYRVQIAELTH